MKSAAGAGWLDTPSDNKSVHADEGEAGDEGGGTDASIGSFADAEADAAAKRQSDAYTAARGGSLVEKFLKSKGGKKAGGGGPARRWRGSRGVGPRPRFGKSQHQHGGRCTEDGAAGERNGFSLCTTLRVQELSLTPM